MKSKFKLTLYSIFIISSSIFAQDQISTSNVKPKGVQADAGNDIKSAPNSTVTLDASGSIPDNGSLTYEWSFPPALIFKDTYNYSETDNVTTYEPSEVGITSKVKASIKQINTRNKFLEFVLPEGDPSSSYSIILTIRDHIDRTDKDTVAITYTPFIPVASENTIDNELALLDEEIKLLETEIVIEENHTSIQHLGRNILSPMEVEYINGFIYKEMKAKGIKNIVNPGRYIEPVTQLNRAYDRSRIEVDTLINTLPDTLTLGSDISGKNIISMDTLIVQDTLVAVRKVRIKNLSNEHPERLRVLAVLEVPADTLAQEIDPALSVLDTTENAIGLPSDMADSSEAKIDMSKKPVTQLNRAFDRSRIEIDTLINTLPDTLALGSDISGKNIISMDTLIVQDTLVAIRKVRIKNLPNVHPERLRVLAVLEVPTDNLVQEIDPALSVLDTTQNTIGLPSDMADSSEAKIDMSKKKESLTIRINRALADKKEKIKEYRLMRTKVALSDTTVTIDTLLAFVVSDTLVTYDTIPYVEVVDTLLYYDFNCVSDSCAAENALLSGVGQVLTWSINEFYELEIHSFDATEYLEKDPLWDWVNSIVQMDPDASRILRYPGALAISGDGTIVVSSGNDQTIYELKRDQEAVSLFNNKEIKKSISNPAGIDINEQGVIYFTDKDSGRLLSKSGDNYLDLLSEKRLKELGYENKESALPTKVRVGRSGDIYVLFESDESIIRVSGNNQVSRALRTGVVNGISDIAVNSQGELFIVSPVDHLVYQVINDSTVVPFAGSRLKSNMVKDNQLSTNTYMDLPVAIDFDKADNLYIAEESFGLILKVDKAGMVTILSSTKNNIKGINSMRVSQGDAPEIIVSQPQEHQIQRVSLKQITPWSNNSKIDHPNYIISQSGIYGLENELEAVLSNPLKKKVPKRKKITQMIRNKNHQIIKYVGKNPVLLFLLFISISSALEVEEPESVPGDFPLKP